VATALQFFSIGFIEASHVPLLLPVKPARLWRQNSNFFWKQKKIMIPNPDELPFSPDEPLLPEPDSEEIIQHESPTPEIKGPVTISLDYLLTQGFEPSYPIYPAARKQARQRLAGLLRETLPLGSQQREIVQLIVKSPDDFLKKGGEVNQSRVAEYLGLHQTTVRYHLQQLQRYL
jgi:hypothetical protein